MNKQTSKNKHTYNKLTHSAKECAYLAVFVTLLIAAQAVLSIVPGVEVITVLFASYSFVMGIKRGIIAAIAFAFLRQIVFGVFPPILVLYLIYFPLLTLIFGALGKKIKKPLKFLVFLVITACFCTMFFTVIDNILTPLWYGFNERSTRLYFMASLPFMTTQVICSAISVACLFYPLYKVFYRIKNGKVQKYFDKTNPTHKNDSENNHNYKDLKREAEELLDKKNES